MWMSHLFVKVTSYEGILDFNQVVYTLSDTKVTYIRYRFRLTMISLSLTLELKVNSSDLSSLS